MAILQVDNFTPPVPTTEQLKATARAAVNASINGLYQSMLATYNKCMAMVWQNANLTPQQVMDAYGTDAAELFRLAGILKTAVNAATPGTIPDATVAYTINDDGTVTVS